MENGEHDLESFGPSRVAGGIRILTNLQLYSPCCREKDSLGYEAITGFPTHRDCRDSAPRRRHGVVGMHPRTAGTDVPA